MRPEAAGGLVIRAFIRYYFAPTLGNWRALRRICMAKLPPAARNESSAKGEKDGNT